jgi:small GTP-binding protein
MQMATSALKVVLVGAAGVGKSSLLTRWQHPDSFWTQEALPTIGATYLNRLSTERVDQRVLHIWDTAGAERYRSLMPMYLRFTDVVIMVFDLTRPETLVQVGDEWAPLIDNLCPTAARVLVGNKSDQAAAVDHTTAVAVAHQHCGDVYLETSALTGQGVKTVFEHLASCPCVHEPMTNNDVDMCCPQPSKPCC